MKLCYYFGVKERLFREAGQDKFLIFFLIFQNLDTLWVKQQNLRNLGLDQSCNKDFERGLLILDPIFCCCFWGKQQANLHADV